MTATTDDGATFVAPIPLRAPAWPYFHSGKPESLWTYRDAKGHVLFHVLRWPHGDDGKIIMPLTLWRDRNDRLAWELKGVPAPRPLYGLYPLAQRPEAPVLVVEGERAADAAAKIFQGHVAVTSMHGCKAAAHSDWSPLQGRAVTLWPDRDKAGQDYVEEVASLLHEIGATSIAIVDVPQDWPEGWDLADPLPPEVDQTQLTHMLENAKPYAPPQSPPDVAGEIARLAALTPLDYQLARKAAGKTLGIALGALDTLVKAERPDDGKARQGTAFDFEDVEPWAEPVCGKELLDRIAARFNRHLALPAHADVALALWAIHAWVYEASFYTPRLGVVSPVKGCGKSTTLDILALLTPRVLLSQNVTVAALFRIIDSAAPTLLLDEGDTFAVNREELRGLLNAGHARNGNFLRTVGDDHQVRRFRCWCPTAIALIGKLPDTVEDRAVMLSLRRALPGEIQEPLRKDSPPVEFAELKAMAARWAMDNEAGLFGAEPAMPQGLRHRQCDNWRPLIAIADRAGGDWPARARAAALHLSAVAEAATLSIELLADIRKAFDTGGRDRLSSNDLLAALIADPERPWATIAHGKPLDPRGLSRRLEPFGIASQTLRLPNESFMRGYALERFKDAFARYLDLAIAPG